MFRRIPNAVAKYFCDRCYWIDNWRSTILMVGTKENFQGTNANVLSKWLPRLVCMFARDLWLHWLVPVAEVSSLQTWSFLNKIKKGLFIFFVAHFILTLIYYFCYYFNTWLSKRATNIPSLQSLLITSNHKVSPWIAQHRQVCLPI